MRNKKTLLTVYTSLMAAIIFISTFYLRLNISPNGSYINLGDGMIFFTSVCLGPVSVIASIIGSCLADLLSGAVIYIPATFIIKGLMSLITAIACKNKTQTFPFILKLLIFFDAEIIMVSGYFLYETVIFNYTYALLSIPWNLAQATFGIIIGMVVFPFAVKFRKLISSSF